MQGNKWLWPAIPVMLIVIGLWLILQGPLMAQSSVGSLALPTSGSTYMDISGAFMNSYGAAYRWLGVVMVGTGLFQAFTYNP